LILLGDLGDIYSQDDAEIKKLSAIDIVPAPPAGERRYLRTREVQDILATRGLNLRQLRFSGASQVTIVGTLEQAPVKSQAPRKAAPTASPRQVTEAVRKAILLYLQQQSVSKLDWEIKIDLTADQLQVLSASPSPVVSGGSEPWTGPQQFGMLVTVDGNEQQVDVRAEITLPPAVVVASRSLPRGSLIHAEDVRLQPGVAVQGSARVFQSLEDVIGKEVTRGIVEGQILDDQWVRRPILVHKGEIVTVYARTAGIQIRTTARARDEGSRGEVVMVEALGERKTFFARVTGPQEVDVYAHAASVAADSPEPAASSHKPEPVTTAMATPPAPLPVVSLAGTRPAGTAAAASQVLQASAQAAAASSTGAWGEPGSVLQQAALRGKTARAKPAAKQSIARRPRADSESQATEGTR
jgi:flagella basal body P-ring formation protein FlgA